MAMSIQFILYGYAKDSTKKQYFIFILLICFACVVMSLRWHSINIFKTFFLVKTDYFHVKTRKIRMIDIKYNDLLMTVCTFSVPSKYSNQIKLYSSYFPWLPLIYCQNKNIRKADTHLFNCLL